MGITPATSWDNQSIGIKALFGPTIGAVKTVQGEAKGDSLFLSWKGSVFVTEHSFELYRTSPRSGFETQIDVESIFEKYWAPATATRLNVRATYLWNVLSLNPPLLVLGLRGGAGTTFTSEPLGRENSPTRLPSTFIHFLGGSNDLRGFNRLELPGKYGALTTAFGSVELRLADGLPWGLQPFAFHDIGLVGERTLELQPVFYLSPGIGLRWDSPIGAFRVSLARGIVSDAGNVTNAKWTPYFSYGEEF